MDWRKHSLPALLIAALAACGPAADIDPEPSRLLPGGDTYKVYFLGGQSNMEGFGVTAELTDRDWADASEVMIFTGHPAGDDQTAGGRGRWARLSPGFGIGFKSNSKRNTLSDRFGPELSFGAAMAARGEKIALIKYARGGSALAEGASEYGTWAPDYKDGAGLNQYDYALKAIETAMSVSDIDGDGRPDRLVPAGIIWMQGESDAHTDPVVATAYQANLTQMMGQLRDALGASDLPVVIGQIADSGDSETGGKMAYDAEVKAAQNAFVQADMCAALVTDTEDFSFLPDGWHYRSEHYITLGGAFADAVTSLHRRCG